MVNLLNLQLQKYPSLLMIWLLLNPKGGEQSKDIIVVTSISEQNQVVAASSPIDQTKEVTQLTKVV